MSPAAPTSKSPPRDDEQRPLDFAVIRRVFMYTKPYGRLRTALIFLVVTRAILMPLVTWSIAAVITCGW